MTVPVGLFFYLLITNASKERCVYCYDSLNGVEPTLKTSWLSNTIQRRGDVRRNIGIISYFHQMFAVPCRCLPYISDQVVRRPVYSCVSSDSCRLHFDCMLQCYCVASTVLLNSRQTFYDVNPATVRPFKLDLYLEEKLKFQANHDFT